MEKRLFHDEHLTSSENGNPPKKDGKKLSVVARMVAALVVSVIAIKSAEAKPRNGRKELVIATTVDPMLEDAKINYEKGVNAYNNGHFEEALRRFKSAYELTPTTYTLLFNIARALAKLNQFDEAIVYLEKFLAAENAANPNGSPDQDAEVLLEGLKVKRAQKSTGQAPGGQPAKDRAPASSPPPPSAPGPPAATVATTAGSGESPLKEKKQYVKSHHGRSVSLGGNLRTFVSAGNHFNGNTPGVEGGWGGRFILRHNRTGLTFELGYDQQYGTFLAKAGPDRIIEEWVQKRCHMGALGLGKEWHRGRFVGSLLGEIALGVCGFDDGERVKGYGGFVANLAVLGTAGARIEKNRTKIDIGVGAGPEVRFGENDAVVGAKLLPLSITVTH